MAVLYSSPINVIRYTNGTMVKLTASRHEFVSYDYDPETGSGTFFPETIKITASISGNLTLKEWQYSDSSGNFQPIGNIEGVTISGNILTITPNSQINLAIRGYC